MTQTEVGNVEYDKTTTIEPLTLIREVKKFEVLYNRTLNDFSDLVKKEGIWEHIHQVLFPNYDSLSEDTKHIIKRTVRKRWKSLRDSLVKDTRLRTENVINESKKQTLLVQEMQYLAPYIQAPRHRKSYKSMQTYDNGQYSPDFCKLIDDTTIDLTYQEGTEDSNVQVDDDDDDNDCVVSSDALYPSVGLTTSESESGEVELQNGYGFSAEKQVKYTICEIEEPQLKAEAADYKQDYEMLEGPKRKRSDSVDDLHSKVVALVERCNTESQDEDRMFLLSLLSDFKRVPVHKKLKVKSAFVKALEDALD